jgi:hypothetical protein
MNLCYWQRIPYTYIHTSIHKYMHRMMAGGTREGLRSVVARVEGTEGGHASGVLDAAWSPFFDHWLATAGGDGVVKVRGIIYIYIYIYIHIFMYVCIYVFMHQNECLHARHMHVRDIQGNCILPCAHE